MANRLAGESSPYLIQHQDNPVDWYPWGDEAFERARREDKPIFVSIGYAACHWCHVMAHESFEDRATASLMNELFVNVKVDREERPDVDAVYMNAIHVMGQGGGWPLSAFCDSDGKPFFLGTYFPPVDKQGRLSFSTVLQRMAEVYREQRDNVRHNTEAVLDGLRHVDEHHRRLAIGGDVASLDEGLLVAAGRKLAQATDPHHGGFGSKPKFPSSSSQEFLGRAGRLKFGEPARSSFLLQAEKMAAGGIYDHIGGGFARYSVDQRWLIPHFEKMLYDNAQLLSIYGEAYAMTGSERYLQVITETIVWLEREMLDGCGGLFASQDADSEGVEGKYYVWTPEQIRDVLGVADAIQFCRAYGVKQGGNFEHGTTVLERVGSRGHASDEQALANMRHRLLEARNSRVHPETDTKILSAWNGLMIGGLVRAWQATGHAPALVLAQRIADFIVDHMLYDAGTKIHRVYKDGATKLEGTLDDYAFVARGLQRLAEATGDRAAWDRAGSLIETVVERFYEERDGVGIFYMTPVDAAEKLFHRPESHQDGAIPSGAAVAVECLLRIALVTESEGAMDIAERYLAGRAPEAGQTPFIGSCLLSALDLYLNGSTVVITDGDGRAELETAVFRLYAPTVMVAGPWAAPSLTAGKQNDAQGRAQVYVCRGSTCSAPVSAVDAVANLLTAR